MYVYIYMYNTYTYNIVISTIGIKKSPMIEYVNNIVINISNNDKLVN